MRDVDDFSANWTTRVEGDALAAQVIEVLWAKRDSFADPVIEQARREGPDIDAVIAEDFAETHAHVLQHFRALLALPAPRARELGDDPLAFVRRHGVRRAQGGVSLNAVLQAYRTGHKSFWRAMCVLIDELADNAETGMRTAMLLSEYCIDYTDLISVVVTRAYLEEQASLAEERNRLTVAAIDDLLAGVAPRDEAGWRLRETYGLTQGWPMAVIVARLRPDLHVPHAARALSALAQALPSILPNDTYRGIAGIRGEEVVAVVATEGQPGALATRQLRAHAASLDLAFFVFGVGLDVATVENLPRSWAEARIAIDLRRDGDTVSHLSEAGVDDYLRRTADDTARRLAPVLPRALLMGELGHTIEAFAAADLNVKACARKLGVHNNTVYHRLNQVRRLTGADPRTYCGLSTLITALTLSRNPPAA